MRLFNFLKKNGLLNRYIKAYGIEEGSIRYDNLRKREALKYEPPILFNIDKIIKDNYAHNDGCDICREFSKYAELHKIDVHIAGLYRDSGTMVYSRIICPGCLKKITEIIHPQYLTIPLELPEDTKIFTRV